MVPSIFVMLDRMPLTANGKVDRHALAATLAAPNALGEELHVPPRTPNEVALARIWAELLKIEPVGVHDNFFDLGGHSLLAVQMFAQMREELGVDLPIASLFPDATIAHLCRGLEAADHPSSGSSTLVPIQPRGSRPPLFCIHAIDGEVVRYAHLARHLGEEQPFYGLRARGLDDGEKPFTDISEMAAHYVAQMRKVSDGPYLVGGFSFGGAVAAEVATQLVELGQEVALLAIFDTPLDGSAFQPVGQLRGLGPDLVAYVQHLLEPGQRLRFVRGELPAVWRALAWLLRIRKTPPHMQSIESLVSSMAGSSSPHERVARIHLGALARFTPRPYPGRVTLFRARVRPLLASHDAVLGWNSLARGGVEVYPLPGSHAQMFEEPHVATLAELLLRVSSRCRTD
jgi:thioesterase domain-containing protein